MTNACKHASKITHSNPRVVCDMIVFIFRVCNARLHRTMIPVHMAPEATNFACLVFLISMWFILAGGNGV